MGLALGNIKKGGLEVNSKRRDKTMKVKVSGVLDRFLSRVIESYALAGSGSRECEYCGRKRSECRSSFERVEVRR